MQPYGQQPMQPWYGPQPMQYGPQPGYGPAPMGYGAPAPINIVVQNTANAANVGGGGGGLVRVGNKSKGTAAVLAIFLGGLGAHKFYLGQPIMGILYLFMAWTFLPAIVGFFEGIIYLTMNDHDFDMKYNFRLA
jgi:TM2 domain-containing membrane protein YozV